MPLYLVDDYISDFLKHLSFFVFFLKHLEAFKMNRCVCMREHHWFCCAASEWWKWTLAFMQRYKQNCSGSPDSPVGKSSWPVSVPSLVLILMSPFKLHINCSLVPGSLVSGDRSTGIILTVGKFMNLCFGLNFPSHLKNLSVEFYEGSASNCLQVIYLLYLPHR